MSAAAPAISTGQRSLWARLLLSEYFVAYLCVIYFAVAWLAVPDIATAAGLRNVLDDLLPLLIVAVGQTLVLIGAGIDLSVTSIIAVSSVVGASIMSGGSGMLAGNPLAVPAAVLAMLALGAGIGFFNGYCSTRFRMPSFIVTLATMMFFSGFAIWYTTLFTSSTSIAGLPHAFVFLGQGSLGPLPAPLFLSVAVAAGAHLLLERTVYGRQLIAAGANARAAAISGVNVGGVIGWSLVISGFCAAVSSMLYTARLETGTPILGERLLLDIVGAAVIGGTSLFGGRGKIVWTFFGVLFLVLIDTTLKILGASLFLIYAIKGSVILLAAVLDATRRRWMGR